MAIAATIMSNYFQAPSTLAHLLQHTKYDDLAAVIAIIAASSAYISKGSLWAKPDPYRYKLFERPQQLSHGAHARQQQSRNVAERMCQANADIVVVWASQSGTAERLAGRLVRDLTRQLNAKVLLLDVSDVEPASWRDLHGTQLAIILASTFGEGDPSDNMQEFWTWLHEDEVRLPDLRYLAFGLGNSKYKHYNKVIDDVAFGLDKKGARSLLEVGKADDAAGETEENFLEWKEQVFELLQTHFACTRQAYRYEPSLELVYDDSLSPIDLHDGVPRDRGTKNSALTAPRPYALPITQGRELFNSKERNCLHLELDLSTHPTLKYRTGDHLGVWPTNPIREVDLLLGVLGIDDDLRASPCHVRPTDSGTGVNVPTPTTISALFAHYLEICAPVSRECINALTSFAPNETAKAFLQSLSHDKQAYATYLASNYVTFGRLLKRACSEGGAWKQLPLSFVVEALPAMQPRYYSISSSSVVQARSAAITAVVSSTPIPDTEERIPGLATNYLLDLTNAGRQSEGTTLPSHRNHIYAHIRPSAFKLPTLSSAPILMVAAGTGLAPFRAFIQERVRLQHLGREVGRTKLFFGCRNADEDYIYASELAEAKTKLGDAFELSVAFSRPSEGMGVYVQHCVEDERKAVVELVVEQNAHFYVCGSAAMARDVSDTVGRSLERELGWSERKMREFADQQKRNKRWKQDVWG